MSRNVPLDQPLSDENRRHLRQLGSAGDFLERRIDAEYPPEPEALEAFERDYRSQLAKLNGQGLMANEQNDLVNENERLRRELEALRAQMDSQPPASEEESKPSYTGWTKAQLEAEIDRVNSEDPEAKLEKGKVAEMVERLTNYFTE